MEEEGELATSLEAVSADGALSESSHAASDVPAIARRLELGADDHGVAQEARPWAADDQQGVAQEARPGEVDDQQAAQDDGAFSAGAEGGPRKVHRAHVVAVSAPSHAVCETAPRVQATRVVPAMRATATCSTSSRASHPVEATCATASTDMGTRFPSSRRSSADEQVASGSPPAAAEVEEAAVVAEIRSRRSSREQVEAAKAEAEAAAAIAAANAAIAAAEAEGRAERAQVAWAEAETEALAHEEAEVALLAQAETQEDGAVEHGEEAWEATHSIAEEGARSHAKAESVSETPAVSASSPAWPGPSPVTYTSSSTQPAASSAISGTTAGRGNSVSSTSGFADGRGRARELAATASDAVAGAEASGAAHAAAAMGTSLAFCASSNASLANLRTAIAQQEADSLWERRRYWYKPVAMLAGQPYSISEGEALHFCLGKRMIAGNDGATSRARAKSGFLVYDCASRALQAALVRPRGRLASATKAVLRVTATRPCAPADAKWPTVGGVWAFEVIVPVSIALEQQTWMEDRSLASLWLPASPAGMCKQCALGERACVQVRNHLQMGQPPGMVARGAKGGKGGGACGQGGGGAAGRLASCVSCAGSGTVSYTADGQGWSADEPDNPEWALLPGEAPGLDLRSFV